MVKRRLVIVAIYLLAGAVVNVAVAWGCAVLAEPSDYLVSSGLSIDVSWARAHVNHKDSVCVLVEARQSGWKQESMYELATSSSRKVGLQLASKGAEFFRTLIQDNRQFFRDADRLVGPPSVRRVSIGFPAKAFECTLSRGDMEFNASSRRYVPVERRGTHSLHVALGRWEIDSDLPSHPRLAGFAINTLFYATLLWFLILGPFTVRRFLRVGRGLCPKCAYPMGTTDVCTECGAALPTRARATT